MLSPPFLLHSVLFQRLNGLVFRSKAQAEHFPPSLWTAHPGHGWFIPGGRWGWAQWPPCLENQLSGQSFQRQGSQANFRRNQMWLGSLLSSCRPRLTLGLLHNVLWLGLRAGAQAEVASASRYCFLISLFHQLVFNPNRAVTALILLQGKSFFKPIC